MPRKLNGWLVYCLPTRTAINAALRAEDWHKNFFPKPDEVTSYKAGIAILISWMFLKVPFTRLSYTQIGKVKVLFIHLLLVSILYMMLISLSLFFMSKTKEIMK